MRDELKKYVFEAMMRGLYRTHFKLYVNLALHLQSVMVIDHCKVIASSYKRVEVIFQKREVHQSSSGLSMSRKSATERSCVTERWLKLDLPNSFV